MTASAKWIIIAVLFSIAFYVGWFMPILWLLVLITGGVLLAIPTKPTTNPVPMHNNAAPAQPILQNNNELSDLAQQIEQKIVQATSDEMRSGLNQALELIRAQQAKHQVNQATQNINTVQAPPLVSEQNFAPAPFAPAPQPLSPENIAAQKKAQELRNINTILYVASFLLVGAAALFIGLASGVSPTVKFSAVLAVTLLFYVSGILLHGKSQRLRPAAVAFVGTGLALVPFVGLAFYSYVLDDGPMVWWLTSLVGFAAFWLAIYRIRSSVMSYMVLAFIFSVATSSVAVLRAEYLWYFVAIIVTSSLLMLVSYRRPNWLPSELRLPLEQGAQLATPVAIIGSLFIYDSFDAYDFAVVHGVGALHYLANAVSFSRDKTRYVYWFVARVLTISFAATLVYAISSSWDAVAIVFVVSALLVHFYSLREVKKQPYEHLWLAAVHVLLLASISIWAETASLVSGVFVVIGLLSLHQLYASKQFGYSIPGILALAILPITILQGMMSAQDLGLEITATVVLIISGLLLVVRAMIASQIATFRWTGTTAFYVLSGEAILLALISGELMWFGVVATISSLLLYVASFVVRQANAMLASNFAAIAGVFVLYGETFESYKWASLATGVTLGAIWYSLRWYFAVTKAQPLQTNQAPIETDNQQRINLLTGFSVGIVLFAAFVCMISTSDTVVAGTLLGCVGAMLLAYEGYVRKAVALYEVSLYIVTICLQRLVAHVYPEAHFLVYTHWWAAAAGLGALLYYRRTDAKANVLPRSIIALTILSLPTGLYALGNPDKYQILFLLEHVVMIFAGAITKKTLLVRWGAAGVGLAVLWLLRGFTYVLLALLALSLIGLAVWRLMRKT